MRIQNGREAVSASTPEVTADGVNHAPAPARPPAPAESAPAGDSVMHYEDVRGFLDQKGPALPPPGTTEQLNFGFLGGLLGMPGIGDMMKSLLSLLGDLGKNTGTPEPDRGEIDVPPPSVDWTPPQPPDADANVPVPAADTEEVHEEDEDSETVTQG